MSYNHTTSRQPRPYNHIEGPSTSQLPYRGHHTSVPQQRQDLHRNNSFDQGDDNTYPQGTGQESYGSGPYGTGIESAYYGGTYAPAQPPPPPRPSHSVQGRGGYTHQDTTEGTGYSQPSYNPQQYGPSVTTARQPSVQTQRSIHPTSQAHTPYNPAVYQSPNTQYQAGYGAQQYGGSPQQYASPTMTNNQAYGYQTTPQLPDAANYPSPSQTYQQYPNNQSQSQLPLDPTYTPPAPPPPPFSPAQAASSSRQSSTSSRRYSHQGSNVPGSYRHSQERFSPQASQPPNLPSRYPSNGNTATSSPRTYSQSTFSVTPSLNRSLPPTPGTPGPTPPAHSIQRHNTSGRHPQSRPLPGPPQDITDDADYFGSTDQDVGQEAGQSQTEYNDIMREVEAAVMSGQPTTASRQNPMATASNSQIHIDPALGPQPLFSSGAPVAAQHAVVNNYANGYNHGSQEQEYGDSSSDISDPVAEGGLTALREADEQDAADNARRQSAISSTYPADYPQRHDSRATTHVADYGDEGYPVDMTTYAGEYYEDPRRSSNGNDTYDVDASGDHLRHGSTSSRISQQEYAEQNMYDYAIPAEDDLHPFPPTISARVDTGGTGGLSEPSAHPRRLSFDDGDEGTLVEPSDTQSSIGQSPATEGMNDMFFHPGVRQLPPTPAERNRVPQLLPAGTYQQPLQYDQNGRPFYPGGPEAYNQMLSPSGTPVPRSSSLISHGSVPQTVPPIRSKTDADRARILKQQQMSGIRSASAYGSDVGMDTSFNNSAELVLPEIPEGRRRKYNPAKLSTNDFKKCQEPWALSSVLSWIRDMSEGEDYLREGSIVDGIVALFTHKVPTMNIADAEALGARVVTAMFSAGALLHEEEWVKYGAQPMSGVLFQLTGTGCYSSRVHTQTLSGRCYSHHCMRTLKKINLHNQILESQHKVEDWATYYKLTKESVEKASKKEIERQNNLHEIVTTEESYMDQLNVLRLLYRDELLRFQPPVIPIKKRDHFLRDVFGKVDAIKQVNEDHLLAQLKYRQHEQGPWITGFSDIFREWVRKARSTYIEYAAAFPNATFLVRMESERNLLFRQFLDQTRENERSKRLGWDTYLKAPITRLQRYGLLLSTVHKHMMTESEEKANLAIAIEEIKAATLECDAKVAEMSKRVVLSELASKLVLRPEMEHVKLNLKHLGREIIYRGDLQRTGSNKFTWVDIHAVLFDHYMVLAKPVTQRDAAGGLKYEKYDVSRLPIPMDLLILESADDDAVVKSTMKGLGSITTVTSRVEKPSPNMASGTAGPGSLTHTNTAASAASISTTASGKTLVSTTILDSPKDEKAMYPFRVKHLGRSETYTLYAPSAQSRQEWCDKIIEAKTRHAASLFAQNAEPFKLRVIADAAFANETLSPPARSVTIKGTPLDRAIREVEAQFVHDAKPAPVCRANVNCAASFHQPYNNPMFAIGTDYGVYITSANNPRGWHRVLNSPRVTQIAVLEEFSLFLVLTDKALVAHHLDSVIPVTGGSFPQPPTQHNLGNDSSSRRAPQKLSGQRDVGFFVTGRMKDRTLVFYKKRDGISSNFKILEPVYHKSNQTASGTHSSRRHLHMFMGVRKGSTDYFRDFDDFYIPAETFALNLFHSSIAISSARGIEVMTLDKKLPISIPDLKQPGCASIAARIRDQKPLGMFRLSEQEFLLVFEEVGIYVDKLGDVSRAVIMEFVGKAKSATLVQGMYLVLVDSSGAFVEVRNAVNGRLKQVVPGREVRMLDDGMGAQGGMGGAGAINVGAGGKGGTVKIGMQHPEWERGQVVLEMVVNEGMRE